MNNLERITKVVEVEQLMWFSRAEVVHLLSIIEQAEKALTYYAEEPYLGSIGYSAEAIEALKAIRGN